MQVKEENRSIAGGSGSSGQATINVGELSKVLGTVQNALITLQTTGSELVPTETILQTIVTALGTAGAELVPAVTILQTIVTALQAQVGDSLPRVVPEEIQAVGLDASNRTNTNAASVTLPTERNLLLKLVGEPDDALTGEKIIGKGDSLIRVEIVDEVTGKVVESGPESSVVVEIVVLDNEKDIEQNWTPQSFKDKTIKSEAKSKPRFPKPYHVPLVNGSGVITNAKLAHGKDRVKKLYSCRLGVTVEGHFGGTNIQDGWTPPFNVTDSRDDLYKKHYPPCPSDEVWRLVNIGRSGARYIRLKKENILTVGDFVFALESNENKLREIIETPLPNESKKKKPQLRNAEIIETPLPNESKKKKAQFSNADWKATVDHARTCKINPISEADEKRRAEELMRPAFTKFSNKGKRKREDLVSDNVENLGVTSPPHPVNEPNPDEEQGSRGGGWVGAGVAITHGTEGASSSCVRSSGDANNPNAPPYPNINSLEPTSMERSSQELSPGWRRSEGHRDKSPWHISKPLMSCFSQ